MKFHTMFVCYFFVFDCCYLLCACEQYILFTVFYYFSTTVVLYCMDLIACSNPASMMTSSISSPVFTDNGSVKLCMNVNVNPRPDQMGCRMDRVALG